MIVSMKRLTLIAHKDDEQAILEALQGISAVQIIEAGQGAPEGEALDALEQNVQLTGDALSALRRFLPKRGLLTPAPEASAGEIADALDTGVAHSREVERLTHAIARTRSNIEKNRALIASLLPWRAFPADMKTYQAAKAIRYFTGYLEASDLEKLEAHSDILAYQTFGEGAACATLVACSASESKNVSCILKGLHWTDYAFPSVYGKPADVIAALEAENSDFETELHGFEEKLVSMASAVPEIERAADAAAIERDRACAAAEMARTKATFLLEGWLREDQETLVRSTVAGATDAYYLDIREPAEGEVPPSVVQNNAFNAPFEQVTNLYSRPAPDGMDATPYMAPFYVLLFGLMLSDSGYGLVLSIGCWLFLKLKKPGGMSAGIARVLFWGGLSTIVWGALIGTVFGMDFDVLLGTADIFPILVDPMVDPINMLILCFGLGIFHILFGVVLKMKMAFSRGDWQSAIFDGLSWILIVLGLLMLALPATKRFGTVLAITGAAMVLVMKGRGTKNPVKRTLSGLGELYQVTGYLSDMLSYARLFALGVATGVLASVFNDLCSMLMRSPNIVLRILGILVAVALLIALHMFNICINTLGAFVHCARLQYVEFFGKFYETGGRPFRPLGYRTRHVRIIKP